MAELLLLLLPLVLLVLTPLGSYGRLLLLVLYSAGDEEEVVKLKVDTGCIESWPTRCLMLAEGLLLLLLLLSGSSPRGVAAAGKGKFFLALSSLG